ncbi:MAG: V-type ATPase subunit [Spirochaetales bacterium]|nr:V-type ATPase subunit [Spirochaetales bacterium]
MPSRIGTYAFLAARLRTRIGKLLPDERLEEVAKAATVDEALLALRGTRYERLAEPWNATGDLRAVEAALRSMEIDMHAELRRDREEPIRSFIDALAQRLEAANLKDALRLWFDARVRGGDVSVRSGYLHRDAIVHPLDLDAVLAAEDAEGLAAALAGTPYAAAVAAEAGKAMAAGSLFELELALDRLHFRLLFDAVKGLGPVDRKVAERQVGFEVDLTNLAWLVRFRAYGGMDAAGALSRLIPWGAPVDARTVSEAWETGNLSEAVGGMLGARGLEVLAGSAGNELSRLALIERALRELGLLEARKLLSGDPFTIGVVLAYLRLERDEMARVRAGLGAARYGTGAARAREAS